MEGEAGLTYQDFIRMHSIKKMESNENKPEEINEQTEASGGIEIEKVTKDPAEQIETFSFLTNLCRVCGSPGNISIYTEPPEVFVSFKPTPESKKKKVTIAKIISAISGEQVSKFNLKKRSSDNLYFF